MAQTPTPSPTPPVNPAQQDATRPPGTERNQPVPEQARPTQNPTAPPGSLQASPQAPPGESVTPQSGAPQTPGVTLTPTPSDVVPPVQQNTNPSAIQEPREPNFPAVAPRPLPPLPDLTRLGVSSDQTLTLTLNEAIRRALENNNDIEVAREDVRLAETTLRAFEGIYDPLLNFNPQISNLVQAQQSTLGGSSGQSGTVSTTDINFNNSVNKFFSTGGGSYQLFFNNLRRTTNSRFNQINPVYSSSLGVTFTQPLLRDRSIDNNRRQIRIQRKRLEQSDADFRRRTIDVITQVQRAYWDLVFALRDQQNQIENLNLARENLRRVEAQIAAGAAAPLARAEVQTELSGRESEVLASTQTVTIAENNLKQLILKDTQSRDWSAQITPTDSPSFNATPVNLNDALAEARANRPELKRLSLSRDINNIDLQYFKNQTRPRVDLQATVATTGLAGTPVITTDPITGQPLASTVPTNLVGGYARDLHNLFTFGTRNIVSGVAIQIPLRNRTAEANLAGARIQRTQLEASTRLQEQAIEVEVRNAAQAVETARRRVLAARTERENAELQLTGEQRLYQVGRSTTFLLFQRQNALANARNLELRAETDYNKALADLQRATSTTLHANNIIVETPTVP
ncbi:MAG: TolC family protein [Acidobacteriota bacterium]|nr:TolC family protein [Acidobacteriota bacterium]